MTIAGDLRLGAWVAVALHGALPSLLAHPSHALRY